MLAAFAATHALAQDFPQDQVRKGADLYARNCAPCHGARMLDPNSAIEALWAYVRAGEPVTR